jgi:hypothetical protein
MVWSGGAIVAAGIGIGAIGMSVLAIPFVTPALRRVCLPYVPATVGQVNNVVEALRRCPSGPMIDLGSGDGRVVS